MMKDVVPDGRRAETVLIAKAAVGATHPDRVSPEAVTALAAVARDNEGLVVMEARRSAALDPRMPFEDLAQTARLGLLLAVRRYNSERGATFGTAARVSIRGRLIEDAVLVCWPVRVPRHVYAAHCRAARGYDDVSDSAAAPRMAMPEIAPPTAESALADVVDSGPGPVDVAAAHEVMARLRCALGTLPPRWAECLARRFGLSDREPEAAEAIARDWGISRQRVYQVEAQALARLRAQLYEAGQEEAGC